MRGKNLMRKSKESTQLDGVTNEAADDHPFTQAHPFAFKLLSMILPHFSSSENSSRGRKWWSEREDSPGEQQSTSMGI